MSFSIAFYRVVEVVGVVGCMEGKGLVNTEPLLKTFAGHQKKKGCV